MASGGELLQALAAGCPPQSILFAGPGKTDRELRLALSREIGEIHVESLGEARRLDRISRERGRTSRIALRINPNEQAQGGAMRMGGKAAPFGIDEEHLPEILNEMAALPNLEVAGVHLYAGTQILDPKILLAQYGKAVGLAEQVAALLNRALRTIDFGGGLGIPYFPHERELDLGDFGPQLRAIVTRVESTLLLSKARLIIEPGRYLIGECGLYVSSITDIKLSRGKKFMILDGGMHHHLAASGNLGQPIKRNFPIAVLNRLNSESKETVDVVGPLCTPLDVLGRSILLPVAEVGDLVGVFQSGAYARSASPLGFLSHPAPPEIWVGEGSSQLLRRRGEAADLMLGQERNVGIER